MIDVSAPYFGAVRISRDAFARIIREQAAPGVAQERDPGEYWDVCVQYKVDPLLTLAMFKHESQMGKAGVAMTTHSWGNTRRPCFGPQPVGDDVPGRSGFFPRYANWKDGCESTVARLAATDWFYRGQGRNLGQVFTGTDTDRLHVWAPAGDLNNPHGYLRSVLDFMNRFTDMEELDGAGRRKVIRVALSAGHHNHDGGDPREHAIVGRLTPAVAGACRARGMDVRVITPDDGHGEFPGGLVDVAQAVVKLARGGWVPDIYLECHTEGVGNPNVRGVFAIFPDSGDDLDVDVRDRLGPLVTKKISRATGLPIRGNGLMSEKQTFVGSQGHRLGIFKHTAALKASTTRLIIEFGAHSSPTDMTIIQDAAFTIKAARAVAEAFEEFMGVRGATLDAAGAGNGAGPLAADKAKLVLKVGEELPFVMRGHLLRQGEADLRDFGGAERERTAIYEKIRLHTFNNGVEAFMLTGPTSYETLQAAGKVREL